MRKAQLKNNMIKNLDGNKVCEDLMATDKEFRRITKQPHIVKLFGEKKSEPHSRKLSKNSKALSSTFMMGRSL